jgi:hypothetical protein
LVIATAPPVFAQIGPDQPSGAGIPAHRVGDSSASMAPPSQVERCPPNRVNSRREGLVRRVLHRVWESRTRKALLKESLKRGGRRALEFTSFIIIIALRPSGFNVGRGETL